MRPHTVGSTNEGLRVGITDLIQANKRMTEQLDALARHEINRALRKGDVATTLRVNAPGKPWRQSWYLAFAFLA
jgi:hypothetical protein